MLLLGFIFLPLLLAILPVESPCNILIISIIIPLLITVILGRGLCFHIFHTLNNRPHGDPFWKLYCWPLVLLPTRTISIGVSISLEMSLLATFVTIQILPGRWTSIRDTTIYLEVSLNSTFFKCFWKWCLIVAV